MRSTFARSGGRIIGSLTLLLSASLLPAEPVRAAVHQPARLAGTGPSLTTTFLINAPTIDGVIGSGEWGTPVSVSFNGLNSPGKTRAADLYLANTATDLYVGLSIADPIPSPGDLAEIDLDAPQTNSATAGLEDALRYVQGSAVDLFWGGSDWIQDTHQQGQAAKGSVTGRSVYEFRKPLNSGDGHDMVASQGTILGFRLQVQSTAEADYFRYPVDTRDHGDIAVEWGKWSNLTIGTTVITAAPVPTAPANASQLSTMTTTLMWSNPPTTTQVHLQLVPANNDGPGLNLILGNTSSFAVPAPPNWYGLLPGMSYTWRARTTAKPESAQENDTSWGPWSTDRTFRTPVRGGSLLTAVSPSNGAIVPATSQILQWQNGDSDVFYYEIQVSPDANFGEQGAIASVWTNLVHGGVSIPANSWLTPPMIEKTAYFWRVRPRVQGDGTPAAWSQTFSFNTI